MFFNGNIISLSTGKRFKIRNFTTETRGICKADDYEGREKQTIDGRRPEGLGRIGISRFSLKYPSLRTLCLE